MDQSAKKGDIGVVVIKSHVLSREGATLKVERLELSKAGTRLITSTSSSLPDLKGGSTKPDNEQRAAAACEKN